MFPHSKRDLINVNLFTHLLAFAKYFMTRAGKCILPVTRGNRTPFVNPPESISTAPLMQLHKSQIATSFCGCENYKLSVCKERRWKGDLKILEKFTKREVYHPLTLGILWACWVRFLGFFSLPIARECGRAGVSVYIPYTLLTANWIYTKDNQANINYLSKCTLYLSVSSFHLHLPGTG